MATKFSESELSMKTFIEVEQLIRSTFDRIVGTATERRDQLLVQLNDMRLDYINKEETRKKQVSDIQRLISPLMEVSIKHNSIVKLQEEQIELLEKEQKKYETLTPTPCPSIRIEGLESLLEQLRGLGAVEELGGLYREKINPISKFAKEGDKKDRSKNPHGLALYRNENIYITDSNSNRIQIFSTAGKFLSEFGKGKVVFPHSIALCEEWVFVCDYSTSVVLKFQRTNNKLVLRSAEGELELPFGITVDTNGELLVADSMNNRIAVLNLELILDREIGKDKLEYPKDVKINNNNIFVADSNENNNIHVFTKTGELIRSFIKLDNRLGLTYFCFDLNNNIIVGDSSIKIFTIAGELVHQIACESSPTGIAVDNNNNIICVCYNGIVYIY